MDRILSHSIINQNDHTLTMRWSLQQGFDTLLCYNSSTIIQRTVENGSELQVPIDGQKQEHGRCAAFHSSQTAKKNSRNGSPTFL